MLQLSILSRNLPVLNCPWESGMQPKRAYIYRNLGMGMVASVCGTFSLLVIVCMLVSQRD
jgi:hypothetical protein